MAVEQENTGKFISELPNTIINGSEQIPCEKAEQEYNITINELNDYFSHKIINHGINDTSISITPNDFHIWDTVSTLNIQLATPININIINEYIFQFKSGEIPTTLILPQEIKWIGDNKIEANKTYQVSILNNIAVIGGV